MAQASIYYRMGLLLRVLNMTQLSEGNLGYVRKLTNPNPAHIPLQVETVRLRCLLLVLVVDGDLVLARGCLENVLHWALVQRAMVAQQLHSKHLSSKTTSTVQ